MAAGFVQSQLRALLDVLDPSRLDALKKALMQRVLFTVESEVKKVTPVLTGHLRRSIASDLISVNKGAVGTNVIYAPIVNRRNPYMQTGLDNADSTIDKLLDGFAIEVIGT